LKWDVDERNLRQTVTFDDDELDKACEPSDSLDPELDRLSFDDNELDKACDPSDPLDPEAPHAEPPQPDLHTCNLPSSGPPGQIIQTVSFDKDKLDRKARELSDPLDPEALHAEPPQAGPNILPEGPPEQNDANVPPLPTINMITTRERWSGRRQGLSCSAECPLHADGSIGSVHGLRRPKKPSMHHLTSICQLQCARDSRDPVFRAAGSLRFLPMGIAREDRYVSEQISAEQWGAAMEDEVAIRVHGVIPLPMVSDCPPRLDSESEPILTGPGIQCLVSFFIWGKNRTLAQLMEGYNRRKASFPRTKPANTARPCAGPARSPLLPSVPPRGSQARGPPVDVGDLSREKDRQRKIRFVVGPLLLARSLNWSALAVCLCLVASAHHSHSQQQTSATYARGSSAGPRIHYLDAPQTQPSSARLQRQQAGRGRLKPGVRQNSVTTALGARRFLGLPLRNATCLLASTPCSSAFNQLWRWGPVRVWQWKQVKEGFVSPDVFHCP
ncbi:hypothetical protein THAOC_19373, partial [Thalassiosira oceanica]